ncbi:hypothetical protein ABHN11_12985 [Brevibacillus centrosporus]|uniref:hypothetical protein n=1 Tax=Brevibacillus centrosporus TaxID=54910 RepID=UPI003D254390
MNDRKLRPKIILGDKMIETLSQKLGVSESKVPDIPIDSYIKAFGMKTLRNMALDALFSTNHFEFEDGKIRIKSNVDIKFIAGHVFENFIVNLIRIDMEVGQRLLDWATGHNSDSFWENRFGYNDFLSFYLNLRTVAKSSNNTKNWDTNKYSHTSKHDVEFYVRNPLLSDRSICLGGFQVKAIQGNEKNEIIYPLLRNEYSCVLTLLRDKNNAHSYQRCLDQLKKLKERMEITPEEAQEVFQKIIYPEKIGIPQQLIDTLYYRLLSLERKGVQILLKDGKTNPFNATITDGLISFALQSEENTPYIISEGNNLHLVSLSKKRNK